MSDEISVIKIMLYVVDQISTDVTSGSVLRIVLMSVCSRSYIYMSKSDFSVRSDITVKSYVGVCLQ